MYMLLPSAQGIYAANFLCPRFLVVYTRVNRATPGTRKLNNSNVQTTQQLTVPINNMRQGTKLSMRIGEGGKSTISYNQKATHALL